MGADLAGEALRTAALARWAWRSEIKHQVVNTDIDGLLTGALLHHEFDWPIIGFSDTAHSWIDSRVPTPLNLRETTWVDLDMCVPGSRSISQHVVSNTAAEAELVTAFAESVNANLLVGRHRLDRYTDKYPYGTFQWVAWLVGNDLGTSTGDAIASGLAWMPDGGAFSLSNFRSNCLDWAITKMQGSSLAPIASGDAATAVEHVRQAESYLRRKSGVLSGWSRTHQWSMPRGSVGGLAAPFAHAPVQALLDAITELYGWKPAVIPTRYKPFSALWQAGRQPPGWPHSANRREVVSVAVTSRNGWCWTENNPPL
ncbi:hypothetical protein ACFFOS_19220 [Nocardioides kongjuensis]|uniref:Uncharacterized protein n=1 Tax=Nocardioides kongjuensis TaxID=349522 RepID=A0A852R8U2_9ACTN|nr:hypothetical protein [Nocardioides kongjuensis]NYD29407.1 hypothetical protein [Nocardioides kongjuensis]